jgi:RNA polymerase sigma factor (sigma-70 family)
VGEHESIAWLVSQAVQGDKTTLNQLLHSIRKDIHNLSLRMLGDPDEASDATQEILIRILKGIGSFRGGSSFKTWYYRVATNYLLSDLSKSAKRKTTISFDALGPMLEEGLSEPPASLGSHEREMLAGEVRIGCSLGMLQCLNKEGRLVYILGEILGINSVQGAAILGISGDNFRQKLSKARKKITAFAGNYCGLVSSRARCTCDMAINRAIGTGFIDRDKPRFSQDDPGQLLMAKLDRIVDKTALLFRSIPQYDSPPETLDAIRKILDTEQL